MKVRASNIMNYIEYDNSGNIIRTGMCSPQTFINKQKQGINIIEGFGRDTEYMVDINTQKLIPKEPEQKKPKFKENIINNPEKLTAENYVTKKEYEQLLTRIEILEGRLQ